MTPEEKDTLRMLRRDLNFHQGEAMYHTRKIRDVQAKIVKIELAYFESVPKPAARNWLHGALTWWRGHVIPDPLAVEYEEVEDEHE